MPSRPGALAVLPAERLPNLSWSASDCHGHQSFTLFLGSCRAGGAFGGALDQTTVDSYTPSRDCLCRDSPAWHVCQVKPFSCSGLGSSLSPCRLITRQFGIAGGSFFSSLPLWEGV